MHSVPAAVQGSTDMWNLFYFSLTAMRTATGDCWRQCGAVGDTVSAPAVGRTWGRGEAPLTSAHEMPGATLPLQQGHPKHLPTQLDVPWGQTGPPPG